MNLSNETVENLKSFGRGEKTWAEVEGMTAAEAQKIAQTACELSGMGRYDEARVLFEGLVAGNPQDAAAHAALGGIYQRIGQLEEAYSSFTAALALDPKNPVALSGRGELRLRRGDREGVVDLADAVKADPAGETQAARKAAGLLRAIALTMAEARTASKQ